MSSEKQNKAFTDFFIKERNRIIGRLQRTMQNFSEMEIEDVVSEVFLNLLSKADIVGEIENIAAYIYRAASNRLLDLYRRQQRTISMNAMLDNQSGNELGDLLPDFGNNPENETISNEVKNRLYQAIDGLEPKQRAVWIATEMEGYTFRELAELWNEPIGTLLARKHRAVISLQKSLADLRPVSNRPKISKNIPKPK